jgi:hypothetical protein
MKRDKTGGNLSHSCKKNEALGQIVVDANYILGRTTLAKHNVKTAKSWNPNQKLLYFCLINSKLKLEMVLDLPLFL